MLKKKELEHENTVKDHQDKHSKQKHEHEQATHKLITEHDSTLFSLA